MTTTSDIIRELIDAGVKFDLRGMDEQRAVLGACLEKIRAQERERCALRCEQIAKGLKNGGSINACRQAAKEIRALLQALP